MTAQKDVTPYDITGGEKVYYGYYAALEAVFRRFISEMESWCFDRFNLSFQFEFEINGKQKFREYLDSLEQPLPIFLYNLSSLNGDCLLTFENRCANMFLAHAQLQKQGRVALRNRFRVNMENYNVLHVATDELLNYFEKSWNMILPTKKKLKKLVSHRYKAKVMSSSEACVVVRLTISHGDFSTYFEFCFSAYQLDPILKKYGKKTLFAGDILEEQSPECRDYFSSLIEKDAQYKVNGVLGDITLSHNQLIEYCKSGKVLPLGNSLKDNVIVHFNGVPLLSAYAGASHESLSLQVNGRYKTVKENIKKEQKPFARIQFPSR